MGLSPAKQRLLLVGLVVAAIAVAIAANWALLGYADRGERTIGTLSPKAGSLAPPRPPAGGTLPGTGTGAQRPPGPEGGNHRDD